jgi:hypothetical protein
MLGHHRGGAVMLRPRWLGVPGAHRPVSVAVVTACLLVSWVGVVASPAAASTPAAPSLTPGVGEAIAPAPGHSRVLLVPVQLDRRVRQIVRVHWSTTYLTPQPSNTPEIQAPAGDYRASQGEIVIPAGQKRGWATIRITGDTYGREYMLVALSTARHATLVVADPAFAPSLGAYAVGLIAQRGVSPVPTVGFSGGTGVILDQPTDRTVTVDWSVISFGVLTTVTEVPPYTFPITGTLTPAPTSYYTPSSGTITIPPGQTSAVPPITFLVRPPCVFTNGVSDVACYYLGYQLADPRHATLVPQPPPVNGLPAGGYQTIEVLSDNGYVFN